MVKFRAATLFAAMALFAAPVTAPPALADECGFVGPGGCEGNVRAATPEDAAQQAASGQPPCQGANGREYYTQGSDPCY